MTAELDIISRPAPGLAAGAEMAPRPPVDPSPLLASAREALARAVVVDELPVGPTGEWETFRRAIGEPCRSLDPEGRMRHWMCRTAKELAEAAELLSGSGFTGPLKPAGRRRKGRA